MAEEVLSAYAEHISAVTIIPSSGGRFVVTAGDKQLFNKAEAGRFPTQGEVERLLSRLL